MSDTMTTTADAATPQAQKATKNAGVSTQTLNDKLLAIRDTKPQEGEPVVYDSYRHGSDVPPLNDIRQYLKPEVDHKIFNQIFDWKWIRYDELPKNPLRYLVQVKKGDENAQWFKDDSFRVVDGLIGIGANQGPQQLPECSLCLRSRFQGDEEVRQARAFSIQRNFGVKSGADSEAQSEANEKMNSTMQQAIPGDKSRVIDKSARYVTADRLRPANANIQRPLGETLNQQ